MTKITIYILTLVFFGMLALPAFGEVYWQDGQNGYNSINYSKQGIVGDGIGSKQYYVIPLNSLNNYGQNYRYNYNPYSGYNYNNQYNRSYGRSAGTQWGILDNSIIGSRNNSIERSKGYYAPPPAWYKPYVYGAPKTANDYARYNNQNYNNRNYQQGNNGQNRQNELVQNQKQWEKYLESGNMRDYPFPLTIEDIERIQKEGETREK